MNIGLLYKKQTFLVNRNDNDNFLKIEEIYLFKYNKRHNFNFVIAYKINKKINLSAMWIFRSGYPYTLPIARYNIDNTLFEDTSLPSNQAIIYADKNSFRMNSYHRLDIAISFNKSKKRGIRTWKISIYNTYNRQNPYLYYSSNISGQWQKYQQSLFPIIPTFGYSFKFN